MAAATARCYFLIHPKDTNMKRIIFGIFLVWHLGFLLVNNVVMSRETYIEFFEKKTTRMDSWWMKLIRQPWFQAYGRLTGLETGYGFFGFNVRSTGFVIAENGGQTYIPRFRTLEGENRYSSYRGLHIEYLDYMDRQKYPPGQSKSLREKYLDLGLRSVAAYALRDQPLIGDTVFAGYYILELPTLKQAHQGKSEKSLLPVKKFSYVVSH